MIAKLFQKLFSKPATGPVVAVPEVAPAPVVTEVKTSAPETKKSVEEKEQPAQTKAKISSKKNKNK